MQKQIEELPDFYWQEAREQGHIEKLSYFSSDVDNLTERVEKYAYIYLPCGYDENNSVKKYNILYFMHGAGTTLEEMVGQDENQKGLPFQNVLDHMIQYEEIEPLIVVFPTYYKGSYTIHNCTKEGDIRLVSQFPTELVQDLIPAVEMQYHTFANLSGNSINRESVYGFADTSGNTADNMTGIKGDALKRIRHALKKSRTHRAFGGFSMGAVATWNVFAECLEFISIYLPFSGDCWAVEYLGGRTKPWQTADCLSECAQKFGYQSKDFKIYAATGTKDIAYTAMWNQIEAMKQIKTVFYGEAEDAREQQSSGGIQNWQEKKEYQKIQKQLSIQNQRDYLTDKKQNIFFQICKNGLHDYTYAGEYLYNILRACYKNQVS